MHSKTLIEPSLVAVPASLKLLLFINYKEVPCCYGPSQLPTRVTRMRAGVLVSLASRGSTQNLRTYNHDS